jgi:hypothetical protein
MRRVVLTDPPPLLPLPPPLLLLLLLLLLPPLLLPLPPAVVAANGRPLKLRAPLLVTPCTGPESVTTVSWASVPTLTPRRGGVHGVLRVEQNPELL